MPAKHWTVTVFALTARIGLLISSLCLTTFANVNGQCSSVTHTLSLSFSCFTLYLSLNMVPRVVLCVQTGWIFIGWIQFFTIVGVGTWKYRYFSNYVIINLFWMGFDLEVRKAWWCECNFNFKIQGHRNRPNLLSGIQLSDTVGVTWSSTTIFL